MTLGRFSVLLSVVCVALPFASVFTTGQVSFIALLLIAPIPPLVVYNWFGEYEDWTIGHVLERLQGEPSIAADLDDALRAPLPHVAAKTEDDGAFVLPGVPALQPRPGTSTATPPASARPSPPASTPPR